MKHAPGYISSGTFRWEFPSGTLLLTFPAPWLLIASGSRLYDRSTPASTLVILRDTFRQCATERSHGDIRVRVRLD